MKPFFYLFLIFSLGITGCQNVQRPEKPEAFIEEDEMVEILYDVSLLKSLKTYSINEMRMLDIKPESFIYDKYDIDSLQLAANINYYSVNFNEYAALWEKVNEKVIEKQQEVEDEMVKGDSARTLEIKQRRDSIKNSQKKPKENEELKGLRQSDSLVTPISG